MREGDEAAEADEVTVDLAALDVSESNLAQWLTDHASPRWGLALTGNFAPMRGDVESIAISDGSGHVYSTVRAALTEADPNLAAGYRAAALRTAQRAHAPQEVFEVLTR